MGCHSDLLGQPRLKVIMPDERAYTNSYLWIIVTFPVSSLFQRYLYFSCFLVTMTFKVKDILSPESTCISLYPPKIVIRGLSYTFLNILTDKNIILLLWPFRVIQGQRSWCQMKDYVHVPIYLWIIVTICLTGTISKILALFYTKNYRIFWSKPEVSIFKMAEIWPIL